MKKTIIIFFLTFISSNTFSQNITVAELTVLHDSSLDQIEEKLTNKSWIFYQADAPTEEDDFSRVAFTYVSKDKLQFGIFIYMYNEIKKSMSVLTNNQNKYLEYLRDVKTFKPEMIDTFTTEKGKIVKVYKVDAKYYIFEIGQLKSDEQNFRSWQLTITNFYNR